MKCRPFYLPRGFTSLIVATVYIASSVNAKANDNKALRDLNDAISELLNKLLISLVVIAGVFNLTA